MESTHRIRLFICAHLYWEETLLYRVLVSQTKTKAQLIFRSSSPIIYIFLALVI